ncbi:hypothetical protein QTJ16_003689 [Diplocarpon rosae]|uniref:Uncharacterized protein n=1 Tax=Diplocarpon rosae TaxID=946125 RepID=A0AAD9T0U9_9HELO|nr:hypothetical protein QTJ16_003689 [Diplocarpon rosae]PBP28356.1 hypothetical protein BUE80_DR000744 [Diplocarpon rosae]
MDRSSQSLAFIVDFDGTITTKDTISALADFGIAFQKSKGVELTEAWQDAVARYGEDYSRHIKSYKPITEERKTLVEVVAHLRSLKNIELSSFGRVGACRIFKAIGNDDWRRFGRGAVARSEVEVTDGFRGFVAQVHRSGGLLGIVSVNFSREFIRGVLEASAESNMVEILANQPDEKGTLLGPKGTVLATSDAKLAAMKQLLHAWKEGSNREEPSFKVVYVGDSAVDIECLTAKEVLGIVISADGKSGLMDTLRRININITHISKYGEGWSSSVYWARDFKELCEALF